MNAPSHANPTKTVLDVLTTEGPHWVGDGFPVRSLFSYLDKRHDLSPFLLLDHAGPEHFEPTDRRRGVGKHPHRGFETVSIVYDGEAEHRDSTGAGGTIGPGDVQWMTAGSGILHSERHSQAFAQRGGTFEMVQLWVNLPAAHKMTAPAYQRIEREAIPVVPLPDRGGELRVIAGAFGAHEGPARTFSPIDVWDLRLDAGGRASLDFEAGRTALLAVLRGTVTVGDAPIGGGQVGVLDRGVGRAIITSEDGARVLVLSGEPLGDPVVGHGPFVMTSRAEIEQAVRDLEAGRFVREPEASP